MTDVSAVVRSALAQRRRTRAQATPEALLPPDVCEGDLRIVAEDLLDHSPADQRIGLVLRIDSVGNFAEILLVHTAPELATDHDVILPADITSAPYVTVAQTGLRAVVWTLQLELGERVGHLANPGLEVVKAIANTFEVTDLSGSRTAQGPQFQTGTRLAGLLDSRWSFKESEGAALRALAANCTEVLLALGDDELGSNVASILDPNSWLQHRDLRFELSRCFPVVERAATGIGTSVKEPVAA